MILFFLKTRKTKTVIKMLRTEYDIRLVTLVRTYILFYTHSFFFLHFTVFVQNTLQYPTGKKYF